MKDNSTIALEEIACTWLVLWLDLDASQDTFDMQTIPANLETTLRIHSRRMGDSVPERFSIISLGVTLDHIFSHACTLASNDKFRLSTRIAQINFLGGLGLYEDITVKFFNAMMNSSYIPLAIDFSEGLQSGRLSYRAGETAPVDLRTFTQRFCIVFLYVAQRGLALKDISVASCLASTALLQVLGRFSASCERHMFGKHLPWSCRSYY